MFYIDVALLIKPADNEFNMQTQNKGKKRHKMQYHQNQGNRSEQVNQNKKEDSCKCFKLCFGKTGCRICVRVKTSHIFGSIFNGNVKIIMMINRKNLTPAST